MEHVFRKSGKIKPSIAMIQPYFGKFPNYFPLHLKTIEHNPEITWIFFTDDTEGYDWPVNAEIHSTSFEELRELIRGKFPFPVALDAPYKLCDFRPAYGYIFSEYLKDFDFWGHCDADVLWGNLDRYLSEEKLVSYDMLYREGAFRIFRNTDKMNFLFQREGGLFSFREVFSHKESHGFDEALSIQRIAEKSPDVRSYHCDNDVADINAFTHPLYIREVRKQKYPGQPGIFRSIINYKYQIFVWEDGHIFRWYLDGDTTKKDEFMYLHLMKRKMELSVAGDGKAYMVLPSKIIVDMDCSRVTDAEVRALSDADIPEQRENRLIRKMKKMTTQSWRQNKVNMKKVLYCFRMHS
jgi:hypothetical protein